MLGVTIAFLIVATALYVARGVVAALGLLRRSERAALGRALLAAALGCHTAFVALRAIQCGGLPIASRLDSVALFLWLTAGAFALAARPYGIRAIAPVFWPCFAAGMLAMWLLAGREAGEPAAFARLWLTLHLVPVYIGYAGFALAAGAGAAYLVQERLLRLKDAAARWRRLPSLATLQRVEWAALSLGYPVLTLGLVVGFIWAYQASSPLGRAWYADPKVLGGGAVWVFYTAVLHLRLFLRLQGRRAAVLTVLGFALTLLSFGTAHLYESSASLKSEIRNPKSEMS